MIPNLNDPKWSKQMVKINIDRISLLCLVGVIELVLRHPNLPTSIKENCVHMGRSFAVSLLNDGLIVPDVVLQMWEKAFNIPFTVDPDLIIPGLTDQEGRPWK